MEFETQTLFFNVSAKGHQEPLSRCCNFLTNSVSVHVWSTVSFDLSHQVLPFGLSSCPQTATMISLPPITPVALPSSAAGILNSSAPLEKAVPTVSKAVPLDNPLETSAPETGSAEESSTQASCDQPNGVAATEDMTKQVEQSGLKATSVSQQGLPADPAESSADLPAPKESKPSVEAPVASSELHIYEEAATAEEKPSQSFVATEESASDEVKATSIEAKPSGEEPGEKNVDDSKPYAPEDANANNEDGLKTSEDRQINLCLDGVTVATQNENLDKKEPAILLSTASQSKGCDKCEAPPISTRHLSGWFILYENQMVFFPHSLYQYLLKIL